jgi:hypothetical protein
MQAESQRREGNTAAAAATESQLNKLINDAVLNGQITNRTAFRQAIGQQLVARHSPDVAAILAQPKKFRQQYMQQGH